MMDIPTVRRSRTARRASIATILETLESRVVMSVTPTSMALVASSQTVGMGQSLTLNAFVVGKGANASVNEGSVTIRDGSAVLGTAPVVKGQATVTTTSLEIGTHKFSATYSGSPAFLSSRTEVQPTSPVRIVAGSVAAGYTGDGGPAVAARLNTPGDVAADAAGNIYIADSGNFVVRKVGPDGVISTFAGNGSYGNAAEGVPATAASIGARALALDAAGNLYIANAHDRVRRVGPDGIISTFTGKGPGIFGGDGGPAIDASMTDTVGIEADPLGNVYISSYFNNVVRRISPDGIIRSFAGIGIGSYGSSGYSGDGGPATSALLSHPFDIAADAAGNVYIVDSGNDVVRKVDPDGIISTVTWNETPSISSDPGRTATSMLGGISSVRVDASGNLYIAGSHKAIIRRVSPDGTSSIVVGGGTGGDGSPASDIQLGTTYGMAFDAVGNLYIADGPANVVRMVSATTDVTVTPAATTAVLATSATSLRAGRELTLTATVVSAAGIVDEGTATFRDGSAVLGTVAVVNGSASLTIATLAAGTHQLTVSYDGGARFLPDLPGVDAAGAFRTVQISGPILADGIDPLTAGGSPRKLAADAAGNIYFIAFTGRYVGRITPDGRMSVYAGGGEPGNTGDGGPATQAWLDDVRGMATDAAGNLYLSDSASGVIRKVTPDGIITTIFGHGIPWTPATPTTSPIVIAYNLASDAAGNLYIHDTYNGRVSRLSTDGVVSNVAGTGAMGYSGDGGQATSAQLGYNLDLAVDGAGNLYIADRDNLVIRKVTPDGIITTVAGTHRNGVGLDGVPYPAVVRPPTGLTADASGNVYFIDEDGAAIRRLSPDGTISIIARVSPPTPSGEGGPAYSAPIGIVRALATDAAGNLLVAEGPRFAVRRISGPTRVDVTPAPAGFRITAAETSVVAGFVQTFTVTAVDADGNPVADYDGWLTVYPTSQVTLINGNVRLVDGVGTFQAGLATAGVQRIFVSVDFGATPAGEIALSITPNQAARFVIDVERGLAGRQLRVSVTAQDVFGNTAVGYSGPIRFFSSDPAAVLPDDATLVDGRGEFAVVFLTPGDRFLGVVDASDPTLASGLTVTARTDPDAIDYDPDATFVRSLYRNVLGRTGGEGEVQSWVDGLDRGMTRQAVSSAFVRSIEHRTNQVRRYYLDYLGRALDPGARYWVDALLAGASESSVIAGILASDEYSSIYKEDAQFIWALYGDVLLRSADDVGLSDKTAALASGASRASLVAGIIAAPEAVDLVLDEYYGYYLDRRRDPASAVWEGVLAAPGGSGAEVEEGILSSDEFYRVAGKIRIPYPPLGG